MDKTKICNMALAVCRLDNSLTDVDADTSEAADACQLYFDHCLKKVLEKADWTFASATAQLAAHTEAAPHGWLYRYEWPADCIKPRQLTTSGLALTGEALPMSVALNADRTQQTILAQDAGAYCRYTAKIEDPTKWSAEFVEAMVYLLASKLALYLKASDKLSDALEAKYMRALSAGETDDANISYFGPAGKSAPHRARM